MDEAQLLTLCRSVLEKVLAKRGWELVEDREAFAVEIAAEVRARLPRLKQEKPLEAVVADAVLNRYSHLLYQRVGEAGHPAYERALTELHKYMYGVTSYYTEHNRALAQECAQEALVAVWQRRDTVEDAGAFLAYTGVAARREAIQAMERARREIPETDLIHPAQGSEESPALTERGQVVPFSGARGLSPGEHAQLLDRIRAAFEACLGHTPRRQEVMIRRFLLDQAIEEIAAAMKITRNAVGLLTFHARRALRACSVFQALWR